MNTRREFLERLIAVGICVPLSVATEPALKNIDRDAVLSLSFANMEIAYASCCFGNQCPNLCPMGKLVYKRFVQLWDQLSLTQRFRHQNFVGREHGHLLLGSVVGCNARLPEDTFLLVNTSRIHERFRGVGFFSAMFQVTSGSDWPLNVMPIPGKYCGPPWN